MEKLRTFLQRKVTALALALPISAMAQFNLLSPPDNTSLTVEGLGTSTIDVTWQPSSSLTGSVLYTWHADVPGGDFSAPLASLPSNVGGTDTVLTLSLAAIENLMESLNFNQGQTALLDWIVTATNGTNNDTANAAFGLSLTNGNVANPFDLLTPPNAAALTVEGNGTNTVDITWSSSGEGVTYNWLLDLQGGTFANPIISVPSNNAGADTVLTLDLATIEAVLEGAGVTQGNMAQLSWRVHAYAGTDSLVSTQTFDIDLTNGTVANPFDLLTPPNAAALTVEGNGTNTIDITWSSSGEGVTYNWLLDVQGGTFANPIISVPSNNAGVDTVLTLDLATIEAVLEGAGVTQGNMAQLSWRVHAYAGTDSLPSSQTFDIDLTNGAVANAFNLLTPANSTSLTVEGNGTNTIDIAWESAGEGVTYNWLLDLQGGTFANPIISVPSNNTGTDTVLTLDLTTIEAVLESAGITQGNAVALSWRVHAYAGADSLPSSQNFDINLTNGTVANPFDLLTPPNATTLTVEGNGTNTIDITWESAGEGVTYNWLLDVQGGTFANPIISVPSNNAGTDPVLTLDLATIQTVLEGAGVTQGNSANLIWRVHAYAATDSLPSNQDFDIELTNGAVLEPFSLLSPTDGTALTVEGNGTNTIDITWESAGEGATYTWLLDAQGGDFSSPIITVPSNNSGSETTLTLDLATIESVLEGAGVTQGNSVDLIWKIHAFGGTDSLPSTETWAIELTNGAVANAFDLTFPADGFAATIQDDANQNITITWENSGEGVTYGWLLDVASGDFTNPVVGPLASNNSGADAALTLDFATIYSVLVAAGVPEGGTANLKWRVHAYAANDSLVSTSEFAIDLTRDVANFLGSVRNDVDLNIYPNPVRNGEGFRVEGTEAGSTIQIIDLSGKVQWQEVVSSANEVISTQGFTPGVYIIRVEQNEAVSVERMVVQ